MPLGDADAAAHPALRPGCLEGDIDSAGVEDLEFVETGLEVCRGLDREAHALRFHRDKTVSVLSSVDHGPLDAGFCERDEGRKGFVDLCLAGREPRHLGTRRLGLGRPQIAVGVIDPGDEGLHRIIILRTDRIELVIMTTRAADAETEKGLSEVHHDLVERVLPCEPLRGFVFSDLAGKQHRSRHEESRRRILAEGIARDLFADELIIRRVGVERLDHIIAIGPGIGPLGVHLEAVRVGVAHDIEPVLAPALAVAGTCEESIDGIADLSGIEVSDLLRSGRKAGEIEGHPA